MRAVTFFSSAALLGVAAAVPAASQQQPRAQETAEPLVARDPPAPTAPWVEVNDNGQPSTTYTPVQTQVDGSTSYIDAAPHDLTASVYTQTWYGEISTRTGDPPNPTPTGKGNKGAFTRCYNMDGEFAPFCAPSVNSTMYIDQTYYVTWDPDFYNVSKSDKASNLTMEVSIRLDYFNSSSEEWSRLTELDRVPAKWGFAPMKVNKKYHKMTQKGFTNITLTLLSATRGSKEKEESVKLPVTFEKHLPPEDKETPVPKGKSLYIALPTVLGVFVVLLVGGCLWNRKTRRIQLGNVMGRNRGYTGRSTRRMFRNGRKDNDINLDVQPTGGEYRDVPDRRGSDDLGSLAGTPVHANFEQQGTVGGNAFRDEMARQNRQRRE